MNIENIQRQKQEILTKFGEWTAHNIQLDGDTYTIGNTIVGDEVKLKRIVQIVSDVAKKPLSQLRVLDLACLEGLYAMEFAKHGAKVVAIEGRTANIEKARFAKEVLGLSNVELIQDDVRNLNVDKHGHFDAVLCLGLLYHLDAPDIFSFLDNLSRVCTGFAVIDTHVSLSCQKSYAFNGREYWGRDYVEHAPSASPEEKEKSVWASLDNTKSFWFTRASLLNLLFHLGFTSVYECHVPTESEKPVHRITLMAIKGQPEQLICCPLMNTQSTKDIPEQAGLPFAEVCSDLVRKVGLLVPEPLKAIVRKALPGKRPR